MFTKGLKFGMLLQLSVGPVCLFVFNSAGSNGFLAGLATMAAVALVDAIYILLAGTGVAFILKNEKIQKAMKIFGFVVLLLFGINTILGAMDKTLFSGFDLFSTIETGNLFLKGILLTASNPLTILFWSGVFSTQAIALQMDKNQLFYYGLGCVSATVLFLTAVSGIGCIANNFLSERIMMWMNILVGALLILFGIKILIKKNVSF